VIAQILKHEKDAELRKIAAHSLAQSNSDVAVEALFYAAEQDDNVEVRKSAVMALGEIGTPKAQEALVKILEKK